MSPCFISGVKAPSGEADLIQPTGERDPRLIFGSRSGRAIRYQSIRKRTHVRLYRKVFELLHNILTFTAGSGKINVGRNQDAGITHGYGHLFFPAQMKKPPRTAIQGSTYRPPHQPRLTGVSSCILYHKKARVSMSIHPDWELTQPKFSSKKRKIGRCTKKLQHVWQTSSTGSRNTPELTGCARVLRK